MNIWRNLPGSIPPRTESLIEVMLEDMSTDICVWFKDNIREGGAFTEFRRIGKNVWVAIGITGYTSVGGVNLIAWRYLNSEDSEEE